MRISHFICRDEQEREWLLDMSRRLRPMTLRAGAVFGLFVAACLPWFNLLSIVPIALAGAALGLGIQITQRRQRIEPVVFAWLVAQTLIAVAIAINGREHLGDLAILMFPIVGASGGFTGRVVAVCTAYTAALMVALGLGIHGSVAIDDPPQLLVPLGLLFSVAILASAVRRASFEHRSAAVVDELTGMLNRTALAVRAKELTHQSRLTGQPVGLLVADLDEFKAINDLHGHQRGDAVLRDFADRLRKELRPFDLAYRLGGEEFIILMPGADSAAAEALAERLLHAVNSRPLAGVKVTVSLGVAASSTGTTFHFGETFSAGDDALYQAKRAGRARIRVATPMPGC